MGVPGAGWVGWVPQQGLPGPSGGPWEGTLGYPRGGIQGHQRSQGKKVAYPGVKK
jgi:hypothetical protein